MTIPYEAKEYKVIHGSQLEPISGDGLFGKGRRREKEFKDFLIDSQDFFSMYQSGKNCDNYRIGNADAQYVYVHVGNCVTVTKSDKGYRIHSNGRHRGYVARKYGLNLLVCILKLSK